MPFPEEVPQKPKKPKILESSRRRGLKSPKSLFFFWFFWYLSRKMQAFGGKRCHFLGRYQKNQKKPKILEPWRRRGLKSPKSLDFLVFLVPLQENASFWWNFLGRYQKTKKNKDFRVFAKARPEESKIFVFLVFWYPSRKMQAFGGKRCHFLRRYQKNKKKQRF